MQVSAIVLTKNNSQTIKRCLKSLLFCQEIIIIDDYSTDETLEIVKKFKEPSSFNIKYRPGSFPQIKIFKRKLGNDFASQRNFGLKKATGKWVLFIDSDEVVSQKLQNEIKQVLGKKVNSFYLKRQDKFMGKIVRHGETKNIKLIRLAKMGRGKWNGKVHETWNIKGKLETLQNPLIHDRDFSIAEFLERLDFYSSLRAEELYKQKIKEPFWRLFLNPIGKFLQNYILRLGFLDGIHGLVLAWLMSWHSFLVRLKLIIMNKNKGSLTFPPSKSSSL